MQNHPRPNRKLLLSPARSKAKQPAASKKKAAPPVALDDAVKTPQKRAAELVLDKVSKAAKVETSAVSPGF